MVSYNSSFLYSGGSYTALSDPFGADGTAAQGINASGQIVGFYRDGNYMAHGFLATPNAAVPEAPPVALLALGLVPLALIARRRA